MGLDRLVADSPPDVQARQRARVREMFDFAERPGCRHAALVGYFGEQIGSCGTSCDGCADLQPRVSARPEPQKTKASRPLPAPAPQTHGEDADGELFQSLRALRKRLADQRNVPAYVVLSDATLLEIARRRPANEDELRAISGIGPKKLELYGEALLALIAAA